jgi:hypothetical protein
MENNAESFDSLHDDESADMVPPKAESKESRMKRLMGFRGFPKRTQEEKLALLGSEERVQALDSITTTTLPSSKKEMKKGVVLEVAERHLISEEILRTYPLVYLGSGIDIEYALALGGKIIVLVDPILAIPEIKTEAIEKIKHLSSDVVIEGDTCAFEFDFGNGKERVTTELVAKAYSKETDSYALPDKIGAMVLYASQGPRGRITVDNSVKERIIDGGIIIEDTTAIIIKDGQEELIELGS